MLDAGGVTEVIAGGDVEIGASSLDANLSQTWLHVTVAWMGDGVVGLMVFAYFSDSAWLMARQGTADRHWWNNAEKYARVEGAAWELVVVILLELVVVGMWSSFSKSLLRTWLRDKLMRRFRLVRLRSRSGFRDEEDEERNSGTGEECGSSVDTAGREGAGFVSGVIVDEDLS